MSTKSKKPWITSSIIKSIKKRDKMYKKAIQTKSEECTKNYKNYRKITEKL